MGALRVACRRGRVVLSACYARAYVRNRRTAARRIVGGEALASQLAAADRAGPAAAPAGGVAGPAVAPEPAAEWRVAGNMGGRAYGDVVVLPPVVQLVGDKHAIGDFGAGMVFLELVARADVEAFLDRAVSNESRVLPIRRDAGGRRTRTLASAAAACSETPMPDWALRPGLRLPGPRTARWCLDYLLREGVGIEGHHERVKAVCRLDAGAWGVAEHRHLCQQLRAAVEVDQVDICNLLSVELAFRRLQTIEFSYSEKAREVDAKSVSGRLSLEEQAAFGGVSRTHGALMVCPALTEHVRQEVEKEAKLAKNLRVAREEREASKKDKGPKKPKEGGGE